MTTIPVLLDIHTEIVRKTKIGYIVKARVDYKGNTFESHSDDYAELTIAEDEAIQRAKKLAGLKS